MRGWLMIALLSALSCSQEDAPLSPGFAAYERGVDALARHAYELAEREFHRALEADPLLAEAHVNMAMIELDLGDREAARHRTEWALVLLERRAELIDAATLAPALAIAHNNLGTIALREGRFDQAVTCYQTALAHDGECETARANMAMLGVSLTPEAPSLSVSRVDEGTTLAA